MNRWKEHAKYKYKNHELISKVPYLLRSWWSRQNENPDVDKKSLNIALKDFLSKIVEQTDIKQLKEKL